MITTVVSETGRHRLVLTHYAPEEECRAHRHGESQISLLLAGAYEEISAEGRRAVDGPSMGPVAGAGDGDDGPAVGRQRRAWIHPSARR